MWIRDSLPVHLPNVRAIIYGYDSRLVKSRSFQSIGEIAGTFRDRLLPMRYSTSNPRPLVFLAHSLGGIILKKALVMLADSGPGGSRLLDRILGGSMSFCSYPVLLLHADVNSRSLFRRTESRHGSASSIDRCAWPTKPNPCDKSGKEFGILVGLGQIILWHW